VKKANKNGPETNLAPLRAGAERALVTTRARAAREMWKKVKRKNAPGEIAGQR
jgi:hypothetical protein